MTTVLVGELTLGAALPAPVGLLAVAQADLQAKLDALVAFSVKLGLPGLSFAAQLQLLAQIEAALRASIAIGLTPPTAKAQLAAVLVAIATLRAQLALYINLFNLLDLGGLFVYATDANTNAIGAELTTALASGFPGHGPTVHANSLLLATVDSATWAGMQVVFKTS